MPRERLKLEPRGLSQEEAWISLTLFKNRNRTPVRVEVPLLQSLRDAIDQTSEAGKMTLMVTEAGVPFSIKGLGHKLRVWCDEAGLPQRCSAHGLRKAAATLAAEGGATERQLMAMFGWLDPKQAAHYARAARQKRLAGSGMTTPP